MRKPNPIEPNSNPQRSDEVSNGPTKVKSLAVPSNDKRKSAHRAYLVAITIDSVAVRGTTEVFRKPVALIQLRQSAGV
jgi:hypothetical protein